MSSVENPVETQLPNNVIIAGGGTAGHVLPGIAIADELHARGMAKADIGFVGSERGVETRLVPEAGYPLLLLPGRGIQRRFTKQNIASSIGLAKAFLTARKHLATQRPDAVVALGGYASVPAGLWAGIMKFPVIVAEQNAVPGLANKLTSKFARACAVSFDGTELPNATHTGNPVRSEILDAGEKLSADRDSTRRAAREKLKVRCDTHIVVFGGSLGARRINNALVGALTMFDSDRNIEIRHIIGSRDFEQISSDVSEISSSVIYTPIEYENDMATVLASADFVLCRAGATSCAELAVMGIPSILCPLPGAPGDHQTRNAEALVATGGAVLVADHDMDPNRLFTELSALVDDAERLQTMADSVRNFGRPTAAAEVVDLILEHSTK